MAPRTERPAPSGPAAPHIRIDRPTFDYGGERPAVDALSFDIQKGESVSVLGPTGCGKSTTLRMFAGLLAPTSGSITISGRDIVASPAGSGTLAWSFSPTPCFST